jgi:hypothetical protein
MPLAAHKEEAQEEMAVYEASLLKAQDPEET